jgi:cell division septum initiation protein DivIVA
VKIIDADRKRKGIQRDQGSETMREPISPFQLREMRFKSRFWGFDRDEVSDVLHQLADDLDQLLLRMRHLQAENNRLREQPRDRSGVQSIEPAGPAVNAATDQAVQLFGQAQQVADSLIEDAEQRARELVSTARTQQRGIMDEASDAAASARDIEYLRTFAKVAQTHFRNVLDDLNEKVDKLGEIPRNDAGSLPPPTRTDTTDAREPATENDHNPWFMRRR